MHKHTYREVFHTPRHGRRMPQVSQSDQFVSEVLIGVVDG